MENSLIELEEIDKKNTFILRGPPKITYRMSDENRLIYLPMLTVLLTDF
jgi:hypothetical protein